LTTRDTVETDTPANSATCRMDGVAGLLGRERVRLALFLCNTMKPRCNTP
jgi:hypothetical protein